MGIRLEVHNSAEQLAMEADVVIRLTGAEEWAADAARPAGTVIPAAVRDAAAGLHARGLFKAEPGDTQILPTLGLMASGHAVYVGTGGGPTDADALRKAGAAAARAAVRLKAERACLLADARMFAELADGTAERAAQALAEGLLLGYYTRKPSRKEQPAEHELAVALVFEGAADAGAGADAAASAELAERLAAGVKRGVAFGEATRFARELTNLPGNMLTPEMLALEAESLASSFELEIEVIDEWTATEQGMGGLLGVGQGSANPPRMIVLHYEGNPADKEKLGLIGKGITFDTGGISLKRADGMEEMISDMGGAAAVLGAMRIIGELKPAVNVVAVIPAAENMPSDRALKPGDVLTTMSGLTVEVVNTDAEGRLVLADGLTTAIGRGATRLIDVATLTGAVMVALGDVATGAVTNDEPLLQQVVDAGRRAGERIWPLPAYPEYRKQLESDAADLKNSGGRYAGAITGGLFIGAFAEELPWVHLDIGGTAWLYKDRGWEPKGATGVMTRTLAEFALRNS